MKSREIVQFPNFLGMMAKKFDEINAEDEIREAFKVFDSVRMTISIFFSGQGLYFMYKNLKPSRNRVARF